MTRQAPFSLVADQDATLRRLADKRQRIDDHNLARVFGLAERHARKLRHLQAAEERASGDAKAADDPPEAA